MKSPRDSGAAKAALHPRNLHQGRYDLEKLSRSLPELGAFVARNAYGDDSIDFADARAVRTLNRALLKHFYGVDRWEIPEDYLCPPIPGRADYVHHAADLLASCDHEKVPRGPSIRVLDVGVGANLIYPLIGQHEYGWSFVGSDVDAVALKSGAAIIEANPALQGSIELRRQKSPSAIFRGVIRADERFDLVMSNPPFHSSLEEAEEGSARKWRNLGKQPASARNFGGQGGELWCPGGERTFIQRMIEESVEVATRCLWFTTLVSKSDNLAHVYDVLDWAKPADVRLVEMSQGQKKSRIVAWTFANVADEDAWVAERWRPTGARSQKTR